MQAMLFSAGLGTRLQPLTNSLPKALAPFGNTTLLGYNLKFLASQGIDSFIINTHHFHDKIKEYLKKNDYFGLDIYISHENKLLDTAGGVAYVKQKIKNSRILLYNVDVISGIDIKNLFDYHIKHNADITLAIRNRKTSRYLLFDSNDRMTGWKNKKTGEIKLCNNEKHYKELAFSGISLVDTCVLNEIKTIEKKSLISFYLDICKDKKILAYNHGEDHWFDCGTIEKLKIAENYIFNNN